MLQHSRAPRRGTAQQCIIEMRGKKKQFSHRDTCLDICSMCTVLYFTLVGNVSRVHLFILSQGMATAAYSNAKPEGNAGWISKHMRPKLRSATPQRCMFTLLQLVQEVNLCNSQTHRCSHISMHIPAWALWPICFITESKKAQYKRTGSVSQGTGNVLRPEPLALLSNCSPLPGGSF
jgi:hypothetical protein